MLIGVLDSCDPGFLRMVFVCVCVSMLVLNVLFHVLRISFFLVCMIDLDFVLPFFRSCFSCAALAWRKAPIAVPVSVLQQQKFLHNTKT